MRKLLLVLAVFCCAFQLLAWKTLRIENDPKAKGLDFQLEYPDDWEKTPGKRPNIVVNISKLPAFFTVQVLKTGEDFSSQINPAKWPGEISKEEARPLYPDTDTFIEAKRTLLEGEPALVVEFKRVMERAGLRYCTRFKYLGIFYRDYSLRMTAGTIGRTEEEAEENFHKNSATFEYMFNSLVLSSKWKQQPPESSSEQPDIYRDFNKEKIQSFSSLGNNRSRMIARAQLGIAPAEYLKQIHDSPDYDEYGNYTGPDRVAVSRSELRKKLDPDGRIARQIRATEIPEVPPEKPVDPVGVCIAIFMGCCIIACVAIASILDSKVNVAKLKSPCPKCSARKPEPVQENLEPAAPGNISITCPKCKTGYEVSGDLTGCRVECFECHCKFYAYPDYLLDENRARVQKVPEIHWEQGVLLNGEAIGGTEPPTVAAPAYKPEAPPAVPMERQFEEAFTRTMNDTGIFAAAEPGRTEKQEPESKQPAPVAKGKSIRFKTRTDFFAYALFGGNLLFDILTYRGNPLYMVAYILPSTIVFLCLVGGPWAIYNLGKVENRKIRCIIANLIFCVAVLWLWAKVSVYLGR